jgi:hypothetical protein
MIVLSRAHDGNRSLLMTSLLIQLRRGRLDNLAYLAAPKRRMNQSSAVSRNDAAIPRNAMRSAHLS